FGQFRLARRQENGLTDKRINEVMGQCHGHLYCDTCRKVCRHCFPEGLYRHDETICDRCKYQCPMSRHSLIKCERQEDYCKGSKGKKNGGGSECAIM
ncbi:Hypothetical predicted protein, partial [Mytilus galloprovincialis]